MKNLNDYKNISGDVWGIFKKYMDDDADLTEFVVDVADLGRKYGSDMFMKKLAKVYFDELNEIKG